MFSSAISGETVEVLRVAMIPPGSLRLSVVIPSYDTAEYVTDAIHSVLSQTCPDLEIIVVDDGSSDGSVDRILGITDPRVTCIWQDNRGLSGARNTGIRFSRAELIGFCDSDDVWHPRKAERHLAVMDGDPTIGVTFSFSAYLDERGIPTGRYLFSKCAEPNARDLIRRNCVGNGSSPVVRRLCFDEAGLFDESLRSNEDLEMWVRIAGVTSRRFKLIPEVLTGYRVRGESLSMNHDVFIENGRLAIERFKDHVPSCSKDDLNRSLAELLRISSRKCLVASDPDQSRKYYCEALRQAPTLPLTDLRAFVLGCVLALSLFVPDSWTLRLFDLIQDCTGRAFSTFIGNGVSRFEWEGQSRKEGGPEAIH